MKQLNQFHRLGYAGIGAIFLITSIAFSHCEIPCGIYGDKTRIELLAEHITTIEKSIKSITSLRGEKEINYNQLVRWVNNKEHHAQEIQDIVTAYFLTQRIKPVGMDDAAAYKLYSEKTVILQQMLVYAMKAKQSTDAKHCQKLTELTDTFSEMYFSAEDLQHLKDHK